MHDDQAYVEVGGSLSEEDPMARDGQSSVLVASADSQSRDPLVLASQRGELDVPPLRRLARDLELCQLED